MVFDLCRVLVQMRRRKPRKPENPKTQKKTHIRHPLVSFLTSPVSPPYTAPGVVSNAHLCSAVFPLLSTASTSAPALISIRTALACPNRDAMSNALTLDPSAASVAHSLALFAQTSGLAAVVHTRFYIYSQSLVVRGAFEKNRPMKARRGLFNCGRDEWTN